MACAWKPYMYGNLRVAAVQFLTRANRPDTLRVAAAQARPARALAHVRMHVDTQIARAAKDGANLVVLPEAFTGMYGVQVRRLSDCNMSATCMPNSWHSATCNVHAPCMRCACNVREGSAPTRGCCPACVQLAYIQRTCSMYDTRRQHACNIHALRCCSISRPMPRTTLRTTRVRLCYRASPPSRGCTASAASSNARPMGGWAHAWVCECMRGRVVSWVHAWVHRCVRLCLRLCVRLCVCSIAVPTC